MRDRQIVMVALIMSTLAVLGCLFVILIHPFTPRIAYVRTVDLVSRYKGTKESRDLSQSSAQSMSANLDTLRMDYRKAVEQYNKDYVSLSASERSDRESHLAAQEEQMDKYSAESQQKVQEAEQKLMQGILSQITTFIEAYGKREGYDMIFGTTSSGSLLYAGRGTDVTEEILAELNTSYSGEHVSDNQKK